MTTGRINQVTILKLYSPLIKRDYSTINLRLRRQKQVQGRGLFLLIRKSLAKNNSAAHCIGYLDYPIAPTESFLQRQSATGSIQPPPVADSAVTSGSRIEGTDNRHTTEQRILKSASLLESDIDCQPTANDRQTPFNAEDYSKFSDFSNPEANQL